VVSAQGLAGTYTLNVNSVSAFFPAGRATRTKRAQHAPGSCRIITSLMAHYERRAKSVPTRAPDPPLGTLGFLCILLAGITHNW
jgi:hypothetical protein